MVYRHVTPPGSGNKNEPTPEDSHVYKMTCPKKKRLSIRQPLG